MNQRWSTNVPASSGANTLTRRIDSTRLIVEPNVVEAREHFMKHNATYEGKPVFVYKLDNGVNIRYFFRAAYIQEHLDHDYLVKYFGCYIDEASHQYWLVEEHYEADLSAVLDEKKKPLRTFNASAAPHVEAMRGDVQVRYNQMRRVLSALVYLAGRDYIHRSIFPASIYLTSAGQLKLGGLRLPLRSDVDLSVNAFGDAAYLAQELLMAETDAARSYSEKSDVYAFAVLLNEFLALERPYRERGLNNVGVLQHRSEDPHMRPRLYTEKGLSVSPQADEVLVPQLLACLRPDPVERPTFQQLLSALPDLTAVDVDDMGGFDFGANN